MNTLRTHIKLQYEFSKSIVNFSFFTMITPIVLLMFYLSIFIQEKAFSISIGLYILNLTYIIFAVLVNFQGNLKASAFFKVSRKNYYISSLGYFLLTAFISSLIQLSIFIIETFVFKFVNIEHFNYFNFIFNKLTFGGAVRFAAFTGLFFFSIALVTNFISILQYTFGAKVWLMIIAVTLLIYEVNDFNNISVYINSKNYLFLCILCLILSCIFIFLSWMFIRKADIKN